ncbi:MAG: hypothetical protein WCX83_02305 [Candidatus Cloacimonas sp.]|nr:hypothetical protein [Candidatus Cloacimonadota bacterium]
MQRRLIIVIGAYGSGKSEYAINLAKSLKKEGEEISLADLDVVNPYFRSRDVKDYFAKEGIDVISPEGVYGHADLPMISPRISGAIKRDDRNVILDVGGDPAGCRALGRFTDIIKNQAYEMHYVVNTMRPFTSNVEDIESMIDQLESASGLKITEMVANPNLLTETDQSIVENGLKIINEVAERRKLAFNTYLVIDYLNAQIEGGLLGKNKVVLEYYLRKPWERVSSLGV